MEEMAARKNEWYLEYILKMTPDEILPGAKDLLEELRMHNIKLALGSASKNAPVILNRIGLTHHFDKILDGNAVTAAKPAPDIFLIAAKALGELPEHCIVFEDAEAGIDAAISAGMRCVGIGSPDNLGRANLVIPNLKQFTYDNLKDYFIS
jgi:beta-phosphoglucomutase